jgi:hypothetical protein
VTDFFIPSAARRARLLEIEFVDCALSGGCARNVNNSQLCVLLLLSMRDVINCSRGHKGRNVGAL